METIYQKIKILNHAFCLMRLNGLKEEYCSSEIAPKSSNAHLSDQGKVGKKSIKNPRYGLEKTVSNPESLKSYLQQQ